VPELGLNTHSGENPGTPHSLTIEEIHHIRNNFKKAAQRAVKAGADGIEVGTLPVLSILFFPLTSSLIQILAGNGWLIDQFLHDNINKRTDEYGGTVENRSRFGLEVVDAVAEVVGYQRVGIRISPFS
jgi:2,4-dienoyl-CoA reductase-like NADH-dependent reductase (Old Yellow Enzyme family)